MTVRTSIRADQPSLGERTTVVARPKSMAHRPLTLLRRTSMISTGAPMKGP